jgi:hypothetical protein
MGGSRSVVVLLLAVPPDLFWCGQPPLRPIPIHSSRHFKCAPAQSQRLCLTPTLASFGLPCSRTSIHALSFCGNPFDLCQPSGWGGSHLPSHCGIPTTTWPFLTVRLLHLRPDSPHALGSNCLTFCSGGYLSPASELDAGGTLAVVPLFIRMSQRPQVRYPSCWLVSVTMPTSTGP